MTTLDTGIVQDRLVQFRSNESVEFGGPRFISASPQLQASTITWTIHLTAKSPDSARKTLDRVQKELNIPFDLVTVEPYWKAPGEYRALLKMTSRSPSRAEATYSFLRQIGDFGRQWMVSPLLELESELQLEATANQGFRFSGISFASCTMRCA